MTGQDFDSLPRKGAADRPAGVLVRLFFGPALALRDSHIISLLGELERRGAELGIYKERCNELEAKLAEARASSNGDLRRTCDWLAGLSSKPALFDTSRPAPVPRPVEVPEQPPMRRSQADVDLTSFYARNKVGGEETLPTQEHDPDTSDADNSGERSEQSG